MDRIEAIVAEAQARAQELVDHLGGHGDGPLFLEPRRVLRRDRRLHLGQLGRHRRQRGRHLLHRLVRVGVVRLPGQPDVGGGADRLALHGDRGDAVPRSGVLR